MNRFKQFLSNPQNKLWLYVGAGVGTVMLIMLAAIVIVLIPKGNNNGSGPVNEAERNRLLTEILQNNTQAILDTVLEIDPADSPLPTTPKPASPGTAQIIKPPKPQGADNYRLTSVSTLVGPAFEKCRFMQEGGTADMEAHTEITAEFFGENNAYYSRYARNDDRGNLASLALNIYNSTKNNSYLFNNGKFALLYDYGIQNEAVTSSPATIPNDADYYKLFAAETEVSKNVDFEGNFYTMVERSFTADCYNMDANLISPTPTKFINRYYVDPASQQIKTLVVYIGAVAPQNMLYRNNVVISRKQISETEAAKEFAFNYSVEVKHLDFTTLNNEPNVNAQIAQLKQLQITPILPVVNATTKIEHAYILSPANKLERSYILNRDFYAATPTGEEMFTNADKYYYLSNPEYSINTRQNGVEYNIAGFSDVVTLDKVRAYLENDYTSAITPTTLSINVDNNPLEVVKLTVSYKQFIPVSMPTSTAISTTVSTPVSLGSSPDQTEIQYYYFTKNNSTYLITTFAPRSNSVIKLKTYKFDGDDLASLITVFSLHTVSLPISNPFNGV